MPWFQSQTLQRSMYHQELFASCHPCSLQSYYLFRSLKANSFLCTSSAPCPNSVKLGSFLSPLLPPLIASHLKSHQTLVPLPVTWLVLPSHIFFTSALSSTPSPLFLPNSCSQTLNPQWLNLSLCPHCCSLLIQKISLPLFLPLPQSHHLSLLLHLLPQLFQPQSQQIL